MRFRKSHDVAVDEENPYWMSFSDIMSALLVIFILASVILILQLMEIQKELEERQAQFDQDIVKLKKAEQVRRTILDEAVEELRARNIKVEVGENHTVLRIPVDLLGFKPTEYEIRGEKNQKNAYEIGSVLTAVLTKENRLEYLDTVFVEGHTDDLQYNNLQIKGNWGLSTFRAISLWQYWQKALPEATKPALLRNSENMPLFSVSGYAETRPLPVNKTAVADPEKIREMNRRIDIRFTIRHPDIEQYGRVGKGPEAIRP